MFYIDFLDRVHRALIPQTYLEVGVRFGRSLALARCRAVGVDPMFKITCELDGDIALVRSTSDEYFSRPDPLALTDGRPFDLAFIDGLHILEFALRDFINAERYATSTSVIVFDDVLPRSVEEAARDRSTSMWTGDVFWVLEILTRYRPDLVVVPVASQPTGLLLVLGLDPENRTLTDHFDEILAEFRRADPQPVPAELLDRLAIVPPRRVLGSGLLELLRDRRGVSAADLRAELGPLVGSRLGTAFAPFAAAAAAGLSDVG